MEKLGIYEQENFLSDVDCTQIIRMAYQKFGKATTLGQQIEKYRVAQNMWFDNSVEFLAPLRHAVAALSQLPLENQETVHIVKYNIGGEYKSHHDYFHQNTVYYDKEMSRGGQRLKTILVYLNDNFGGGETDFPEIDLRIKPKTGKLVMWNNIDDKGAVIPYSLHAGLPVTKGVKYLLTIWIRENKFM